MRAAVVIGLDTLQPTLDGRSTAGDYGEAFAPGLLIRWWSLMTSGTETTTTQRFPRWAGPAAMLGGLLSASGVVLHSLAPEGCIGDECSVRAMREATGLVTGLQAVSAVLVAVGVIGLILVARRSGRSPRTVQSGLLFAAAGFLVLLSGVSIQVMLHGGDFAGMPYFVVTGMLSLTVGFVLIGIFILRSGVLPRWLGAALLFGAALLIAANEQTGAVLLAIPFALSIAATGYFMWTQKNGA